MSAIVVLVLKWGAVTVFTRTRAELEGAAGVEWTYHE